MYKGQPSNVRAEAQVPDRGLFPQLGIVPPEKLTLADAPRDALPPYIPGSAASLATGPDGGPGFLPGDTLVAMTDPADPGRRHPRSPTPWTACPGACSTTSGG